MSTTDTTEDSVGEEPGPKPGPKRSHLRVRLVSAGTGLLVIGAVAFGLFFSSAKTSGIPDRVPAFNLPELVTGSSAASATIASSPRIAYPLTGTRSGHPVVFTYFASWCGPCQSELPMMATAASVAQQLDSQVEFIGIDGGDPDLQAASSFVNQSKVKFPVASDLDQKFAISMGLFGPPSTVFVDRTGHVVHVVIGPIDQATLQLWITKVSAN